ncbi:MAG: amidase [Betaproteobacteria bacterium]|nr:amidase [Betaproteobacteria bacterium]
MSATPVNELSAFDAARLLQRRDLSAEDYAKACLARIDARESLIGAFAYIRPEQVLDQARALDRGPIRGPLHGLTVGIKDVFDTRDMPTQGGSEAFRGHQPATDAAVIALLRGAGAVMLGKTVTTELATFPPNGTRNPRDPAHTPGGSSSGSAAAVADCMVPFATATQTLGSTIRPAGYCGVAGYKPTYNLLPRRGVWPNAESVDTVGLIARDVRDVAMLAAAAGHYPALAFDDAAVNAAPVIGFCQTWEWSRADSFMHTAFDACRSQLAAAGARVLAIDLPESFRGLLDAHRMVAWYEMARGFADIVAHDADRIRKPLLDRTLGGLEVSPATYLAAQALGRACREQLANVFGECDVLFAPAATGEAPAGLESTGDTSMNQIWTFLHGPSVSVTGGFGPNGLPLAMQVLGRIGDDARTLRAARWVERVLGR